MPGSKSSKPSKAVFACNSIRGRRPVLQNCTIAELEVDPRYQRSLEAKSSQALIRAIARDWDWNQCDPLAVGRREVDGRERFFVVDGQHRLAAARLRRDIYDLPCVVSACDDLAEEVASFVGRNRRRRPLSKLDLLRAGIAGQDEKSVALMQMLAAAGLQLAPHTNFNSWKPGVIANVSGIERARREHGDIVTSQALRVLAVSFEGQVLRYAGTIFPGIAAALAAPPEGADDELLIMLLSAEEQSVWARDIGSCAASAGIHLRRAAEIVISKAFEEAAAEMLEEAA
ncbi:DUF6551 family protein [Alteraurantiacibacter palmitatis]|uniref:DUF6551 family protein n=1 Tax=Alteraurantiacibacter palmitatis TaxID=2054628 RepID=A0ABV7E5T2_9SPHN